MKQRRWGHFFCFSLMMITSCAAFGPYLDIARDRGLSAEYITTLERWTRSQIVYSQFETKVRISATCRNAEFNRAYLAEYERLYRLSSGGKRSQPSFLSFSPGGMEDSEFIFYAYVPEKEANDFDRQGSIWSIFLLNARGKRISPIEVRRIEPVNQLVREFFPYLNPYYGIAYRLRFPPNQFTGKVRLVFTGVVAHVELAFDAP